MMNVNLIDLSTSVMKAGDEIGIFDGANCVGSAMINFENIAFGKMSIPVSCNDGLSQTVNGFISNNTLSFKVYRNGQDFKLTFTSVDNAAMKFAPGTSPTPAITTVCPGPILFAKEIDPGLPSQLSEVLPAV